MSLCSIDRVVLRYSPTKKYHLSIRTLDPDNGANARNFDAGTHREFEFLKAEQTSNPTPRIIGTDGGATYSPELSFFESKEYAAAGAPALVGAHHIGIDFSNTDVGAQAFWKEGEEYLLRIKSGVISGSGSTTKTYTNEPLRRLFVDYEMAAVGDMPSVVLQTTISNAVTLKVFNLADGIATDDAYNGLVCRVIDKSNPANASDVVVSDWDGTSKLLGLDADAITANVGDRVTIYSKNQGPVINPVVTANFKNAGFDEYLVTLHENVVMIPNNETGLSVTMGAVKSTGENLMSVGAASAAGSGSFRKTTTTQLVSGESAIVTVNVTRHGRTTAYERAIARD